ncbi:MAG TPA: nickel pincer cofactor biosynthesis protein LarC [Kofleriaceae bacterium]|nr:nickel pincer cofactor biosynthesis protein LarC [Kofleriaceae bacterium]
MKGKHLHLDCASGIAGDMTLGALIDLGVPVGVIGEALDAIGAGAWRLTHVRVVKQGIAAVDVKVNTGPKLTSSSESPMPALTPTPFRLQPEHGHYHYGAIRKNLVVTLTGDVLTRALDIFDRLARAEATLHGTTVEQVEFHEVGAIDSIVDVVGTAAALAWLAPAAVSCASVAMGHGTLKSAHGVLPVPAPAALEVLREAGGVMTDGGLARELCTPTGAAILAASVTSWTAAPTGRALAVGWGAGDLDFADRPNVVRAVLSEPSTARAETVWQIEANIDDMSGELCAAAAEAILAAGALDTWWTPITMKKGRPALVLSALTSTAQRDAVIAAILRETTTIGVRFTAYDRVALARETVEVATPYGAIPIKLAKDGDIVRNAAPEYEACAAAAKQHGVPVKLVYAAAVAAYAKA